MLSFLTRRILGALTVLLLMSAIIYGLIGLMPGDPVDLLISADPEISSAEAERLRLRYGLDQPLYARYARWLGAAVQGDFGYSRLFGQPVLTIITNAISNSFWLLVPAFILALLVALPLGVLAAIRANRMIDYTISLVSFAGISVPPFWLALMLILLFAVNWQLLPAGGIESLGASDLPVWLDRAQHLVLPTLCLILLSVGGYIRFVRGAMLDIMDDDHLRVARAKGLSQARVLWRHALPNAAPTIITIVALNFGALFSGALITETMFAYPGLGQTIYGAIEGNDYNLALVGLLLATAMVLAANLLADLLYAVIDPRITFGGEA
ncbi:MAG: ABC transporter permease [Pseudomonadota bacterium]